MFGLFKQTENTQKGGKVHEPDEELNKQLETVRNRASTPTLWLFGKTGSGKSSIVRQLTGSTDAKIGQGFRPETKFSRRYDFPNSEEPLLRFLDTRGLGEAFYDPSEDIKSFDSSSHLILITVRLADHALDSLIGPLRQIRNAVPDRPVLLVLTCLHEASPDRDLSAGPELLATTHADQTYPVEISQSLQQLIDLKRKQFEGLFDNIALIDFTREDDGFANNAFGEHALKQHILAMLPAAYRQTWAAAMAPRTEDKTELHGSIHWQIMASSFLAATASAVPIPWVNMPVVLAIQSRMVNKIALIYEQKMTSKHWIALSNVAGTQVALRLASRELLKFIPIVGIAASIAASFAFTFALGKVVDWYFSTQAQGKTPSDEELKAVFADQLARGHQLWGKAPK